MPAIRGLTVAVGDWYARTLDLCLAANMRHLVSCVIVTSPADDAVKAVASKVPGVEVFETDAFTRPDMHGKRPRFNKGLAIHEAVQSMGRDGWFWIFDADVIFPSEVHLERLAVGRLHGCYRRILDDPSRYTPALDWNTCPRARDGSAPIGFTQIFAAEDPILRERDVWYDVSFGHAGGGDCYFLRLWPGQLHTILPFDVLHIGKIDTNWMGCDAEGRDLMAKYVFRNQWRRAMANHTAESAARGGELPGRFQYEGFPPSTFRLPFEKGA